jgi:hypothetical protein
VIPNINQATPDIYTGNELFWARQTYFHFPGMCPCIIPGIFPGMFPGMFPVYIARAYFRGITLYSL